MITAVLMKTKLNTVIYPKAIYTDLKEREITNKYTAPSLDLFGAALLADLTTACPVLTSIDTK